MKKTLIPISLILVIVIVVLLTYSPGSQLSVKTKTSTPTENLAIGQYKEYGVIRTTGLGSIDDEKSRLGLTLGDYQLTDLTASKYTYSGHDYYGFYLEDTDFDYPNLVGGCVEAEIQLVDQSSSSENAYDRLPAKMLSLSSIPREKCAVYSAKSAQNTTNSLKEITLLGVLKRETRPSPDISYDYSILLDTPFIDTENASGMEQEISSYIILPATDLVWGLVEDNIDKSVTLTGSFEWGFAESKFFRVTKVVSEVNDAGEISDVNEVSE